MLPNPGSARSAGKRLRFLAGAIAAVLLCSSWLLAQGSSTGNLSGTVIGPKGASVSGAAITLTKKLTGEVFHTITSPAGTYVIHDLPPGDYILHVEAQGFRPYDLLLRINAAATATGDVRVQRLPPPPSVLIDAQSAAVKSTQTSEELEDLPSARNPFDLTFVAPAVQILDVVVLGPSKSGDTSVAIAGRTGRTARIVVDGVDISDETMGATTQNVPVSSIQELKVEQSLPPLSSGLASAGAVNLLTKSGSNDLHGQLFGNFRDKSALTANFSGGQNNPYSREVFGGDVGGALKKDKLFFFLSGEYFKQDLMAPVVFDVPFTALDGSYRSPFRETRLDGRLDYKLSPKTTLFYRFTYDNNSAVNSSAANNYQPFHNRDNSPSQAGGLDFTTGSYVHSLRFAYLRYSNSIADAVNGTNIFDPAPGISLNFIGTSEFASGPNSAAPQHTIQANKEVRYDGSRMMGVHSFDFGFALNKIDGLVLASLYSSAPQVGLDMSSASTLIAANGPGGVTNPLNYPVHSITLGSTLGCFSEKSAFGSSCGGVGDTRLQGYAGDVWKLLPNLTLSYGVQYVRDTGRNSSDLSAIPCSAVNASFGTLAPCTGSGPLLNSFGTVPGLGNRVRQPNLNFAPQAGVAWDPGKSGRTVFRAGIGLYYDNSEFHNALFDREARLATGAFAAQSNDPCASHGFVILPGNGQLAAGPVCDQPVGTVTTQIAALQKAYQTAFAMLTPSSPNPSFVGNLLSTQQGLLAPNFQTPRSVQFNLGFEHQIGADTVFGVDYLRNITTHQLLGLDTNHVGDAGQFDTNCSPAPPAQPPANCLAALKAINNTLLSNSLSQGCAPAISPGGGPGGSQTAVSCYLGAVPGASITDFASHGLDSGAQYLGGLPASVFGLTPVTGAAFAGTNPLVGRSTTFFPAGRSVYSGLQIWLHSQVRNPVRRVASTQLQLSLTHSSYRSNLPGGLDQDLLPLAADFNHPTAYFGSAPGDRKNQFSSATILNLAMGLRVSFTGHIASPLPQTLFLPASGLPGEIFRTDVTGDGSFGGQSQTGNSPFGDVLPQTQVGAFGRSISTARLNTTIENFNSRVAGSITPAGETLLNAHLLRIDQLQALGALVPTLPKAPPGNVGLGWLRSFDASLAWPVKIRDRFTVEPRISAFNIFNSANFDGAGNLLGGILNGAAGQANGTNSTNRASSRIGFGSGVFGQGAPRQVEFGLKISF